MTAVPCSHPPSDRVRWRMSVADDLEPETPVRRVCLCCACGVTVERTGSESARQFDAEAEKELICARWREWEVRDYFHKTGWPSREQGWTQ